VEPLGSFDFWLNYWAGGAILAFLAYRFC